jgi:hypothetical protein
MNKLILEFIVRSLCFLSFLPFRCVSSSVDFTSPFTRLLTTVSLAFNHAYDNVMSFISCIINFWKHHAGRLFLHLAAL